MILLLFFSIFCVFFVFLCFFWCFSISLSFFFLFFYIFLLLFLFRFVFIFCSFLFISYLYVTNDILNILKPRLMRQNENTPYSLFNVVSCALFSCTPFSFHTDMTCMVHLICLSCLRSWGIRTKSWGIRDKK